jgi:hypothetical protein
MQLKVTFKLGTVILNILFADDQVILARTENDFQMATQLLKKIIANYNLGISTGKTKA